MGRIANYPSTPATNAYNNLRGAGSYHPLSVETFGDWSVEAGDKVTVSRGTESYTSPVHEATLIWRGQPELELVSNGSQTRDPIGKMEVKKYSSGRSGLRDSYRLYNFEVNQRHLLYDVYNDYYGRLHAAIEVTSSKMWVKMEDWYNGLMGYLEMTAGHLLVQFWGLYDGLSSEFELTRSRLYVDFIGLYDGLKSYTEITRSRLYVDFIGMYDGLKSELEITRSRLYVEFIGLYDGLSSYTEQTSSRLYHRFDDAYNGLWSEFELTASRLYLGFHGLYDGLSSELELTRSRFRLAFNGLYDGLHSELEMTRSRFRLEFSGLYDGLSSELELTRSRFRLEFNGLYDGLHSELELTRSRLSIQFQGLYDGLNSQLELTRSRLSVEFHGLYDGLNSQLELTRSRLSVEFHGLYDGLNSQLELTRSRLSVEFHGLYDGLNSQLELTRSRLSAEFHGLYDGLNSKLELTRSRLSVEFYGLYDGLESSLEFTRSRMYVRIADAYSGLSSYVEQTASGWSTTLSGVVDSNGRVTAASIATAINDQGQAGVSIDGSWIRIGNQNATTVINGKLSAEDITTELIKTKVEAADRIDVRAMYVPNGSTGTGTTNWENIKNSLYDVQVIADSDVPGQYILQKKTWQTANWVNAGTFKKATPINGLTGSWSGSTLTVKTSPDTGNTYTSNISWQFFTGQGGPGETLYYLASYHQDQSEAAASVITGSSKRVQMVKDNNNLIRMQQFTGTTPSYVNNSPFYDISTDIANAKAEVSVTLLKPSYSSGYAFTPRKDGTDVGAQTKYVKFGSSASTADTIYLEVMRNTDSSQGGGAATYDQSTKKYSVPVAIFEKNTSSSAPDSARRNQSIEVDGTDAFNNGVSSVSVTLLKPSYSSGYAFTPRKDGTAVDAQTKYVKFGSSASTADTIYLEVMRNTDSSQGGGAATYDQSTKKYSVPVAIFEKNTSSSAPDSARRNQSIEVDGTAAFDHGSRSVTLTNWDTTHADTTITHGGYTNNSDGYYISSNARDATAVIVTKITYKRDGVDADPQYSHIATAAGNLYKKAFDNGWSSAYNKISLPTTTGSNAYITIETPKASPNNTPNSRQYTMSDYGNDAVRLKTVVNSSEVNVALYTHNKYTAGWSAAFGKMALPDVGTSASMTVKYPPSQVDGAQQSQSYYLDSDNTYVYIKANVGGTAYTIARDTNKKTVTHTPSISNVTQYASQPSNFNVVNGPSVTEITQWCGLAAYCNNSNGKNFAFQVDASEVYRKGKASVTLTNFATTHAESNVTVEGYSNNSNGYYLSNNTRDATAAIVVKISYLRDGNGTDPQYSHIATAAGNLYKKAFDNGWSSAYNKISLPTTTGSNAYITIETPKASPNNTPNSRQYTMSDYGNDAVRLKTVVNSSEVNVALYTHNKYTAGWSAAFGKMALPDVGTSASMTVKYPPSQVDGAQQSQSYYLDSDNTYVYIKTNVGGTAYTIARDTNKKTSSQTEGWNNACSKLSFPTSSGADSSSFINITYPKSSSGTVFSAEAVRYTMELGSGNDAGYVVLNHYNPNVVPVTFVQKVARIGLSAPTASGITSGERTDVSITANSKTTHFYLVKTTYADSSGVHDCVELRRGSSGTSATRVGRIYI